MKTLQSLSPIGRPRRSPLMLIAILLLAAVAIPAALAQLPAVNAAGSALVRALADATSFSEQTNSQGAKLQVTGLADPALESSNAAGGTAFIGQFHGSIHRNAAGAAWQLYEGPAQP